MNLMIEGMTWLSVLKACACTQVKGDRYHSMAHITYHYSKETH